MSNYYERSRENRFKHFPQEIKSVGDFVLVIDKRNGQPLCGLVEDVSFEWNVLGERVPVYRILLTEFNCTFSSKIYWMEVSTLGIF